VTLYSFHLLIGVCVEDRVPLLTIRPKAQQSRLAELTNKDGAVKKRPSLVLKVPPPSTAKTEARPQHSLPPTVMPKKKLSKKERRAKNAQEIGESMVRIKKTLDYFKDQSLFCYQACFISVDTLLVLNHLNASYSPAEVKGVLGEDPQHCIDRLKKHLKDMRQKDSIFTYELLGEDGSSTASEPSFDVAVNGYRSCYSRKVLSSYGELFEHVEREHQQKVLTCQLCQNIFLNYGSYLSHVCFGPPISQQGARAKFRCKLCKKHDLATFLDFQYHMRKMHNVCEICLKVR